MNTNFLKLTIFVSTIIGLVSCDPKKTTLGAIDSQLVSAFFDDQKLVPITTTISNSAGASIKGKGESRLIIQPNTFVTASGAPVIGNVSIEFADYTNRADMILSRILPISLPDPLISGGEYNLTATQNGTKVFVAPGKQIQVNIPQFGKNSVNMNFFKGEFLANPTTTNTVNWVGSKDSSGFIIFAGDTIKIFNDSTGLANADRFLDNPTYVEFTVNPNGATISNNTFLAYCLYKDYYGIWPLTVNSNGSITASHIPNIPVHIIAFGFSGGEFKSGVLTNYTPSNGASTSISISKSAPGDLKALINSL